MSLLRDILYKVSLEEVQGPTDVKVAGLAIDSRQVAKNFLFAAIPGTQVDGHDFIKAAESKGASVILCERMPDERIDAITYVRVKGRSMDALGIIASNFFGNPSSRLQLVGITGTNGKTTIATLSYRLMTELGYKCGLLSTTGNRIGQKEIDATHTTPDVITINSLMADMVDAGCEFCFMEVSSHAADQGRISGLEFKGGVFTNISHDHLDYHKTFDAYIKAKKSFFDGLPKSAFALINADDKRSKVMVQNTKANVITFGIHSMADFRVRILENSLTGLILDLDGKEVHTRLIGTFNASNFLAVYAIADLLDQEAEEVLPVLSRLPSVEGRFDYQVSPQDKLVAIVDYAHTPDALKKVLETINDLRSGNEQVLTVVGCGGNRDKEKRPIMAGIACQFSDQVLLTSDNPRNEEPAAILADMQKGIPVGKERKVLTITDRREAIKTACRLANAGDIILVAGKGHEKYQEIKGVKEPFDDKEEICQCFKVLQR